MHKSFWSFGCGSVRSCGSAISEQPAKDRSKDARSGELEEGSRGGPPRKSRAWREDGDHTESIATHVPLVELERLTFDLKKHCACGGTLKERTIELQGDVAAAVLPFLQQRGYAPVRAGG